FREQIAEAFALYFDAAALHGTSSPFGADNNLDATSMQANIADGAYDGFVGGLGQLVNDQKKLTGFALDRTVEPILLGEKDGSGRPLFVDAVYENTALEGGRLLGRQALYADGVAEDDIVGYAGDFSKAVWGAVGGISYDVSTQATVTLDGDLVS